MKTVKCSLLLVCLLFLMGLASSSTCKASDINKGHWAALDNTMSATDQEDEVIAEDDDALDLYYEQYASDESSDDDTYVDDQGEDSDLEPAPELEGPSGDDGEDTVPAPEPETTEDE